MINEHLYININDILEVGCKVIKLRKEQPEPEYTPEFEPEDDE